MAKFIWQPGDLKPATPAEAKRVWDSLPAKVRADLERKGWRDGEPPKNSAAFAELEAAIAAYHTKFGTPPHVFSFPPETWPRLAAVIRDAVAKGDYLSTAETYWRMGGEPPPDGAVI